MSTNYLAICPLLYHGLTKYTTISMKIKSYEVFMALTIIWRKGMRIVKDVYDIAEQVTGQLFNGLDLFNGPDFYFSVESSVEMLKIRRIKAK